MEDIEVVEIYANNLYSIRFEGEDTDAFRQVFRFWQDLAQTKQFLEENAEFLKSPFWEKAGLSTKSTVEIAKNIAQEANALEEFIHNTFFCLDRYFHPLEGKYAYMYELTPSKGYGLNTPSLLRLYAIRVKENCYIVVYGGIKLAETIQQSPGLKIEVFKRIDKTLEFLRFYGLTSPEDIKE